MPTSSDINTATVRVTLPDDVDLHARPAATFVRAAMQFSAKLYVAVGDREVDAKSLLSVLSLGARRGTTMCLRASGDDAATALDALSQTIANLKE